jgi:RsiW-degrading membrane proteinase PrsW (M82 family)
MVILAIIGYVVGCLVGMYLSVGLAWSARFCYRQKWYGESMFCLIFSFVFGLLVGYWLARLCQTIGDLT